MNLIDLNINNVLLLQNYRFQNDFNNIDHLNSQAILENNLSKKLEFLTLATSHVERFHSFFHFDQSYFHLKLAILYSIIGDKEKEKEQLDFAVFQDHENHQALLMLERQSSANIYKRPYAEFVDYLCFATGEEIDHFEPQGYWLIEQDNINNIQTIIEEIRDLHLRYHQESAKLYLNRALIFHLLNEHDLAKNDIVKAHNLDNKLSQREHYSIIMSQMSTTVVLGLGSNLGDREFYLKQAINKLQELGIISNITCSSIIESKADLMPNSPIEWDLDYLNMAIKGYTMLEPEQLLKEIKDVEQILGKKDASLIWPPREIDIDILAYGAEIVNKEDLTIPHVRLIERNWAMEPFIEVCPDWIHPIIKKTIREIYNEQNTVSRNS